MDSEFDLESDIQPDEPEPEQESNFPDLPEPKAEIPEPKPEATGPVETHHQPSAAAIALPSDLEKTAMGWTDEDFAADPQALPLMTMEESSCRTCQYFRFEGRSRTETHFGECRRNAPANPGKAAWPSVLWDSWCGEWKMGVSQDEMMQMAREISERSEKEVTKELTEIEPS
ncbi:MAG: hypothetical protein HKN23_09110 [Verrucomicrobiales bacterium]|nr:hypothetical protein [Verrucomicrobiales bacterium]